MGIYRALYEVLELYILLRDFQYFHHKNEHVRLIRI